MFPVSSFPWYYRAALVAIYRLKGKRAVLSPNYEMFRNHYFWQHCTALRQKAWRDKMAQASKDQVKSNQGHILMTGCLQLTGCPPARILCQQYCPTVAVASLSFTQIKSQNCEWTFLSVAKSVHGKKALEPTISLSREWMQL